jgi:hypothetical protein
MQGHWRAGSVPKGFGVAIPAFRLDVWQVRMRERGCFSTTTPAQPANRPDRVTRMRCQELCVSAFVLGAATASDNCRHSQNMRLQRARSSRIRLQQSN